MPVSIADLNRLVGQINLAAERLGASANYELDPGKETNGKRHYLNVTIYGTIYAHYLGKTRKLAEANLEGFLAGMRFIEGERKVALSNVGARREKERERTALARTDPDARSETRKREEVSQLRADLYRE